MWPTHAKNDSVFLLEALAELKKESSNEVDRKRDLIMNLKILLSLKSTNNKKNSVVFISSAPIQFAQYYP